MSPKKKPKNSPDKRIVWLKYYLDKDNPATFLNNTESAAQAGYKNTSRQYLSEIGTRNASYYKPKIDQWLDDHGLSETALKELLVQGFKVKETKIINVKGEVKETGLPAGTRVLLTGEIERTDKEGNTYTDYTSVIAIDMDSIEVQRKFIDMGLKFKGLYAPERHIVTVKPLITYKDTSKEQIGNGSEIPQITEE